MSQNKSLLIELYDFVRMRKAYWLVPIILMLILVSLFIILGQSSALSPIIYSFF